jgi:hypothetical protein
MSPSVFFHKLSKLSVADLFNRIFYRIDNKLRFGLQRYKDNLFGTDFTDRMLKNKFSCENLSDVVRKLRDWEKTGLGIYTNHIPGESWVGWDVVSKKNKETFDHQFDLLGSGLVKVNYTTIATGFCDTRYEMSPCQSYAENVKSKIISALGMKHDCLSHYEPIDWMLDFKSGYRWNDQDWYMDARIALDPGADIKVPWELSRFYHLPRMGLEYQKTKNEDIAQECIVQITDWIVSNPLRYGVNWRVSMEVGIRVCNWLLTFDMIRQSHHLSDKFLLLFSKSLFQHMEHILKNQECVSGVQANNHYMANLLGLVYLGLCCPWLPNIKDWLPDIIEKFLYQTQMQFFEDGGNFEYSTQYHRLVLEMVIHMTILLEKKSFTVLTNKPLTNSSFIPEMYKKSNGHIEKLAKAICFTKALQKKNGYVPQFGDNDSGRVFNILPPESDKDHRHVVAVGESIFYGRLPGAANNPWHDEALMFNTNSFYDKSYLTTKITDGEIYRYKNSGISILKTNKLYFAFIEHNAGRGHAHNDLFSFELQMMGRDFIVDGGSYCYTASPKLRKQFRSSFYHNTLCDFGHEQSLEAGLFELFPMAFPAIEVVNNKCIRGCHDAYGLQHCREFKVNNNSIIINDTYAGGGTCNLNLAPGVRWDKSLDGIILTNSNVSIKLTLVNFTDVKAVRGCYSRQYGVREENELLVLSRSPGKTQLMFECIDG